MEKKKILISITSQFGYHTDTYKYCEYLDKSQFMITYIGFDQGYPRYEPIGIDVIYVPTPINKISRYYGYVKSVCKEIKDGNYDIIIQVDSKATLLIRLFNLRRKIVLDIRTGDLTPKLFKRQWMNVFIWITSLFYRKISVISESLRILLNIPAIKTTIIPLGADLNNKIDKNFNKIKLFYIGDLSDRRIDKTVVGLSEFVRTNHNKIDISYDIVGFGTTEKVELLNEVIKQNSLQEIVKFHGRKSHFEVDNFFKECNVGVVFVPMTPWFDCQPATKLYECALAGMAIIATDTKENRREINQNTGVIINDNAHAFYVGLKYLVDNRSNYSSTKISSQFEKSTWKEIVNEQLTPYINNILQK